jgi:hypothetical protein
VIHLVIPVEALPFCTRTNIDSDSSGQKRMRFIVVTPFIIPGRIYLGEEVFTKRLLIDECVKLWLEN